jgi:SAM-dependent methyltransferase
MHTAAFLYVDEHCEDVSGTTGIVVECGSRNVNGSVRGLFPYAQYLGIDIEAGPGVDMVADFREVEMVDQLADVVICCEVLEHDTDPAALLAKAFEVLHLGGKLIMTCAGVGRAEHSAVDGGPLRDGEHYRNVSSDELTGWLTEQEWSKFDVDVAGDDTRCVAWR